MTSKEAIKTIEYMRSRCPYNERMAGALDTALDALQRQAEAEDSTQK